MSDSFHSCTSLTSIDLSSWTKGFVSNAVLYSLLEGCESLTSADLSGWDTSNVADMRDLFDGCTSLTSIDLSTWTRGFAPNATLSSMFAGCTSLRSADLSGWDMTNVTSTSDMFDGCRSLAEIKIGDGFKTSGSNSEGLPDTYDYLPGDPMWMKEGGDGTQWSGPELMNYLSNGNKGGVYFRGGCWLKYDGNGGSGGTLPTSKTYKKGDRVTLAGSGGLSRERCVFLGWSETQCDMIDTLAKEVAAGVITEIEDIQHDTTAYAVWAIDNNGNDIPDYNEATLTYDGNGGDGAPGEVTRRKGDTVTLDDGAGMDPPDPGAGYEGKTVLFAGWSDSTAVRGRIYGKGDSATMTAPIYPASSSFHLVEDVTLYAVWAVDGNGNGVPDHKEFAPPESGPTSSGPAGSGPDAGGTVSPMPSAAPRTVSGTASPTLPADRNTAPDTSDGTAVLPWAMLLLASWLGLALVLTRKT